MEFWSHNSVDVGFVMVVVCYGVLARMYELLLTV
jgi:hypothetical protein